MANYKLDIRVPVPNQVVVRRLLAGDARTADLDLVADGGAQRRISMVVEADGKGPAGAKVIAILREVLGENLSDDPWSSRATPLTSDERPRPVGPESDDAGLAA